MGVVAIEDSSTTELGKCSLDEHTHNRIGKFQWHDSSALPGRRTAGRINLAEGVSKGLRRVALPEQRPAVRGCTRASADAARLPPCPLLQIARRASPQCTWQSAQPPANYAK